MDIIGYVAGALALIGYMPQTIKTIRSRKTKDLSLITFLTIGTSAILWTTYGIGRHIPAIWITNGVIALCTAIIAVIKLRNVEALE